MVVIDVSQGILLTVLYPEVNCRTGIVATERAVQTAICCLVTNTDARCRDDRYVPSGFVRPTVEPVMQPLHSIWLQHLKQGLAVDQVHPMLSALCGRAISPSKAQQLRETS
jgi:hypothetical protein